MDKVGPRNEASYDSVLGQLASIIVNCGLLCTTGLGASVPQATIKEIDTTKGHSNHKILFFNIIKLKTMYVQGT